MGAKGTNIIANQILTPDGTLLRSYFRHDYREYEDQNGYMYYVDGGNDYLRHGWSQGAPLPTDVSIYDDAPHTAIRDVFLWGTYGKNGDQPLKRIKLKDMEDDHIRAILDTQTHIADHVRTIFQNEMEFRYVDRACYD